MDRSSPTCDKDTEDALMLSSYNVLGGSASCHNQSSPLHHHRIGPSFLDEFTNGDDEHNHQASSSTSCTNSDSSSNHLHHHGNQQGEDDDDEEEDDYEDVEERQSRRLEAVDGDEMFDVHPSHEDPGHYRGDEVIDGLHHNEEEDEEEEEDEDEDDHINSSHDGIAHGEEDSDEEEEEEEEDDIRQQNHEHAMQANNHLPNQKSEGVSEQDGLQLNGSTISDLNRQQTRFLQFPSGVLLTQSDGWHTEGNLGSGEWHLPLQHSSQAGSDGAHASMGTLGHTMQVHGHNTVEHHGDHMQTVWQTDSSTPNKVIGRQHTWGSTDTGHGNQLEGEDEEEEEEVEDDEDERCSPAQKLQQDVHHGQYHHSNVDGTAGLWVARQQHQGGMQHVWHKDNMGKLYPSTQTMNSHGLLYTNQSSTQGLSSPINPSETSYSEMVQQTQNGSWTLQAPLALGPTIGSMPQQYEMGANSNHCSQQQQQQQQQRLQATQSSTSAFFTSSHHQMAMKGQGSAWPQSQMHYQAAAPAVEHGSSHTVNHTATTNMLTAGDHHFQTLNMSRQQHQQQSAPQQQQQVGLRCKAQGRMMTTGCLSQSMPRELQPHLHQGKARPALNQARQHSHPYQSKEAVKPIIKDLYPAGSGSNTHSLKASHIVSWYIDYLILENEHLTQISRAFSLPVNLFHSDDFYFMEALKKKVNFPSNKFLSWMEQYLPSININSVDFNEGRSGHKGIPTLHQSSGAASCVTGSSWGGQSHHHARHHHHHHQQSDVTSWQNKSRRDIIHEVFFYFQHRRVRCQN